mmetsp:Transcript_158008/g.506767  ORF Transcript_158008/g.506767 Transcript_158008/m.506767 type:complete len:203 (+) Transcript_158008:542-1150(+)
MPCNMPSRKLPSKVAMAALVANAAATGLVAAATTVLAVPLPPRLISHSTPNASKTMPIVTHGRSSKARCFGRPLPRWHVNKKKALGRRCVVWTWARTSSRVMRRPSTRSSACASAVDRSNSEAATSHDAAAAPAAAAPLSPTTRAALAPVRAAAVRDLALADATEAAPRRVGGEDDEEDSEHDEPEGDGVVGQPGSPSRRGR